MNTLTVKEATGNFVSLHKEVRQQIREFLDNKWPHINEQIPMVPVKDLIDIMGEFGYVVKSTVPVTPKSWDEEFFLTFTGDKQKIEIDGNLWYGGFKIRK